MWGLIFQPLMAVAMPAKMMTDSAHLSMVVEMVAGTDTSVDAGHHNVTAQSPGDLPQASCHKKSADESSSEHCDKCDDNCADGHCATSCVVGGGVAAFQKMSVNLDLNRNTLVITTIETRSYGFSSRIFHPPKHS
tara:strand:- start:1841 stop:2245 length:405 start_codon:yes stop_codon:yes gene_type:complete